MNTDTSPPLVSTEWLAARLGDPAILVLDIRSAVDGGGAAAFGAGHVPGSVHTDYVQHGWRAAKGMVSGLLPERGYLAELFGHLGISPDRHVVVVPAGVGPGDFSAAARVYWTLKTAGHRHISLLDGGVTAWAAEGRPLESGPGADRSDAPYPVQFLEALHADTGRVETALADRSAVFVDSRSRPYFEGAAHSPAALRAGRLPGAVLVDNADAYDPMTNRLRPKAELEQIFAVVPDGPSISYCNTGHQAATDWFVLSEILGRPQASLYDGSMSDWTGDPARPVETG